MSNKTWLPILFTSSGGKCGHSSVILRNCEVMGQIKTNLHMDQLINARNNPTDCPNLPHEWGNFGFLKWCHISSSATFAFKDNLDF